VGREDAFSGGLGGGDGGTGHQIIIYLTFFNLPRPTAATAIATTTATA